MKKKIFILVVFLFSLLLLVGCGKTVEGPQGEPGPAGKNGADGKSAYQLAKEHDPSIGTEEEWLESLQGDDGRNGAPGANGEKGADGQDAREIELFAEDGGVYWRYVDSSTSTLLYYFKDTITVTFAKRAYNSEEEVVADFLKDMQDALNAPAEYTYQKAVAAVTAAQAALADAQATEAAVGSAALNAYKEADKSTDELALAAKVAYLTAVKAEFLADLSEAYGSEITAANIFSTFKKDNGVDQLLGTDDGKAGAGLMNDNPILLAKWGWVFEYLGVVLKNDGTTSSHKYEFAALKANGLSTPEGAEFASGSWKYCNRYIVAALHNFLNMTNDQKGESGSYPQPDFSTIEKYDIDAITAAHQGALTAAAAKTTAAAEAVTAAEAAEVTAKATRDGALITLKADFSNAYDNLYKYLVNDSEKTMDQMVSDNHASGILYNGHVTELGAKWTWLIGWLVESFMAAHDGSINDNKYVSTVYALLNPLYEGRSDATGDYRDRLVMSALHNYIYYLRKDGVTEYDNPSGSGSDSYWKDFFPADPEAYRSLEEAARQDVYTVIKEEEVARTGEHSWKHYELISMEDPLIATLYDPSTQLVRGWIDVEDKAVEAIPSNHSIVLFLDVARKVTVNLEFNGGATEDAFAQAIGAKFIADINAIEGFEDVTAANFYEKLNGKFINVTAVDPYTKSGLLADHPELLTKWGWLLEFVGKVMGDKKYGNTALVAFGVKSANDGNLVTGSLEYADYTVTNSVHNFLNGTNVKLHGGSSSGAVPADFSSAAQYSGFIAATPAELAEGLVLPEGVNGVVVVNGLPSIGKVGDTFACWVLKGDDSNTPVPAEEMEDGETYVAYFGKLRGDEILDEFIADIQAISGFAGVTRANFLAQMSGDKFMGVTAMTDAREFTTAGLCKDNPEFLAKWAWLFEYVGEMLAKPEYSTTEEGPGTSSHKYSYAALEAFGLAYPKQSSLKSTATDFNKVNDYFVSNLANLLNHTNTPHGDNDWHPVVDFRPVANWNNGLVAAYEAAHAE